MDSNWTLKEMAVLHQLLIVDVSRNVMWTLTDVFHAQMDKDQTFKLEDVS